LRQNAVEQNSLRYVGEKRLRRQSFRGMSHRATTHAL